jgi:hypothetical protein
VWFEKYQDRDWPIETSPESKAAFVSGIASPVYAGATFSDVPSPIPPLSPVVTKDPAQDSPTPTEAGTGTSPSQGTSKRCVSRKSKTTGRRVLVCTKATVIRSLAVKARIRSGLSLPTTVPAPNAALRITLSRNTNVVLRFARRSGKRYVAVPGAAKLALQRGEQGVLFAGRLSSKRTLTPGRYRLAVTAVSATGTRSQTVRGTFTLLK